MVIIIIENEKGLKPKGKLLLNSKRSINGGDPPIRKESSKPKIPVITSNHVRAVNETKG